MAYGVKVASLSATGNAVATPATLLSFVVNSNNLSAGSVAFYDNATTASGTAYFTQPKGQQLSATNTQFQVDIPGNGIHFTAGISCALTAVDNVVVFYK